jgi:hypothetical protein
MNAVLTFQPEPAILTQLVRLASQQKQSEEEILGQAVKQYLEKSLPDPLHTRNNSVARVEEILAIAEEFAKLPILDNRTPDEILGYEKSPIGLWG